MTTRITYVYMFSCTTKRIALESNSNAIRTLVQDTSSHTKYMTQNMLDESMSHVLYMVVSCMYMRDALESNYNALHTLVQETSCNNHEAYFH